MIRARQARRVAAAVALVAVAAALAGCTARAAEGGPRRIAVSIRHSAFEPATIDVRAGETVTFVVRNADPIDHELIVGDEVVHRRHEAGTEAHHGAVPGEVTVPAGQTASSTFTFTAPGRVEYACHLPGHYAYGMRGVALVGP